jgi:hypothetical protein
MQVQKVAQGHRLNHLKALQEAANLPKQIQHPNRQPASCDVMCFVDAATTPDGSLYTSQSRKVGLGIYIIDLQVNPMNTIYIRATHNKIFSVVNVEAAALALAATILTKLNLGEIAYFSDCSQLVDFNNSGNSSNPPDQRILPCIQDFNFAMETSSHSAFKIQCDGNSIIDSLAKLVFSSPLIQSIDYVPGCTYETYGQQCPF